MRVLIDRMAWLPLQELGPAQVDRIKSDLTVVSTRPKFGPSEDGAGDDEPIRLYVETAEYLGVAREYYLRHRRPAHDVRLTAPGPVPWVSPLRFHGKLREEQDAAASEIVTRFKTGASLGGILQATPAFGKTVTSCAIMAALGVRTLVVLHKEFLVDQWNDRIAQFLPGARIGRVQQDVLDYKDKHIVLGMVHTLASRDFPDDFLSWPSFVAYDECHRVSAKTWSGVPARFLARWRLGLTATPRRKDGTEDVFRYHLGPVLFKAKEQRMRPKIRRVHTDFRLVKTDKFDASSAPLTTVVKLLCANKARNRAIGEQVMQALVAGRKVMILSERLNHLEALQAATVEAWSPDRGPAPSFGWYVGGKSKEELKSAAAARVVLATSQMAAEGLDVPPLDTLVLATPMSDVEQAVGRILRPCEGKKDPIVVDVRDDKVAMFKSMGEKRDALYARIT